MNLIMYEPNIYINNSKFISIVDNQHSSIPLGPWGLFYTLENLLKVDGLYLVGGTVLRNHESIKGLY